jgi:multidrug efflux pump subunit AcrA (membrane-fusion protein)
MCARISFLALSAWLAACNADSGAVIEAEKFEPQSIKITGELQSANSQFFGPPQINKIWQYTISYMAPNGAPVSTGTVILEFDTHELMAKIREKGNGLNQKKKELQKQEIMVREKLAESRLAVEEARALVDKAKLKADIPAILLAKREYRENQLLLRQSELTLQLRQAELAAEQRVQETEAEILKREISVLETEVSTLQKSVEAMSIRAPSDGVVIHVVTRHGDKLAVGDNVWNGRRVLEFPDMSQLEVHLEIPERESARIFVGQPVSFKLDAAPDRSFDGHVSRLASIIHTKSRNQPAKVFDAIIAMRNPDPELMRPGMNVSAEILLNHEAAPGS